MAESNTQPVPFSKLDNQNFDVIVIGGGIIGAGVARDAALRGLRVALFEKDDFAGGTSSRSTRLIHGGLRYLEMFDFGLVRQDLREREILLRLAPHLVKPLAFVVPMWSRSLIYRAKLRIGMLLYDLLSYDKSLPNHTFLSRAETLRREPKLREKGLQGAMLYYDGQVPSTERLVIENIRDAADHGAQIWNHSRVTDLLQEAQTVVGVQVRHELSGEMVEVRAQLVINVAGPWLDGAMTEMTGEPSRRVRMTKGIHFTAPPAGNEALVLFANDDRLFFVIPWLGYAWVGTTDTDYTGDPDDVRADRDDVEYLQKAVEEFLPKADWQTVYYTTAGLRALVRKEGVSESAVSRKHALVDYATKGRQGIMSVVGGKLTAYRDIAAEATDMACKKLGNVAKTQTDTHALPGGRFSTNLKQNVKAFEAFKIQMRGEGAALGLDPAQTDHLVELYGALTPQVLELARERPGFAVRIHPDYLDIIAQIHYAVAHEFCATVSDFMLRRTMIGYTPDQGMAALARVTDELGGIFGWASDTRAKQKAEYRAWVATSQAWKTDGTPATTAIPTPQEAIVTT